MCVHACIVYVCVVCCDFKKLSLGQVASSVGALSRTPKVCTFDALSRHIPRLWVQFTVRMYKGGNQSMFLSLFLLAL